MSQRADDPAPHALRRRAEARLNSRPNGPRIDANPDVLRLIHELQVHQVELELQNEELRRTRDELEQSTARYAELYDFAPVGYVTLDARSAILESNLVAADLLRTDRARLVGQPLAAWVTPDTRGALDALLAELRGAERAACDLAITGAGGPVFLHLDAVAEAPARGGAWRCRVALTDVTEVKAAARLREADRRKSAFLAVLSHELRNPLAPIANAIRLLERAPAGGEPAAHAREVIERQTAQLTRLVDDLLDLTRIERGKVELRNEPVDLRALVRRTCADYRYIFEQRGIELRLAEGPGPVAVRGDPARLAQVVGNLLHNAAKFTPGGGVVTVAVAAAGGVAELRVRDTGDGVEPDEVQHLFEPFAEADQGPARTRGGLGLGLSLVKGLVELHGGTASGTSEGRGRGAEFVVRLPLAPAAPAGVAAPAPPSASRSVVVIEDNVDAAQTLADVLGLDGHRVQIAATGGAGVELVRRVHPDIVLCDLGLPDMDGCAVISALRGEPALARTRFVALSGYAQPADRERTRLAGFHDHLSKPPDLAALNTLLAREGQGA